MRGGIVGGRTLTEVGWPLERSTEISCMKLLCLVPDFYITFTYNSFHITIHDENSS